MQFIKRVSINIDRRYKMKTTLCRFLSQFISCPSVIHDIKKIYKKKMRKKWIKNKIG